MDQQFMNTILVINLFHNLVLVFSDSINQNSKNADFRLPF